MSGGTVADMEGSDEEVVALQQHAAAMEESLGGEKTTSLIIDTAIQTDVQCAVEPDQPAGATGKKNRMPPELVSHILGMPIDKPYDIVMPSFLKGNKDMTEALGMTEEWLEETYRDANLRVQRLHAKFLKYQVEIRDELFEKGYVEVDDDYFKQQAEIAEKERARWEEMEKKRDPTLTYKDYNEYNILYDYEEQARRLVAL
ncbi:hypothetical protein VPH35_047164 [Triticum aestivum]